jgi:hypothetical protein
MTGLGTALSLASMSQAFAGQIECPLLRKLCDGSTP